MEIKQIIKNITTHPQFYPYSSESETISFLCSLAKITQAHVVLEIGTHLGYAVLQLSEILPQDSKIYTIDQSDTFRKNYRLLSQSDKKNIKYIIGDSAHELPKLNNKILFDLIYLDGAHDFVSSFRDVINCLPHCKQDTYICFHDALSVDYPGIKRVVNILSFTNNFCWGNLYDIVFLKTPIRMNGKSSGLAIIKLKYKSFLAHMTLSLWYKMLARLFGVNF